MNFDNLDISWETYSDQLRRINSRLNYTYIEKAYRLAWNSHRGQFRKSGEPYIMHPVAVSLICAEQGLGSTSVVASLLHDVLEDTPIGYSRIQAEFGEAVAVIVNGVTKLTDLDHQDAKSRKVESYRKMLLNAAEDVRVIIIKFADRIHNLRTLSFMTDEKKEVIARETLEIYAPLAHRLGMGAIKSELEDLAFRHLYPHEYEEVVAHISDGEHRREELLSDLRNLLNSKIEYRGISAEVFGRTKSFYSIFKKNRDRHVPYNEIFDLLAMRVITNSIDDCYTLLGIVHSLWPPVPEKLKDYIASPKSNGYRSIHTTIVGPEGVFVEIQIRTIEMNYLAEDGVAAHWRYKDNKFGEKLEDTMALQWLKSLVEWQKELSDTVEFYELFKIDIESKEIVVRTPKNEKINLPVGATILDFAFSIHSNIGLHCIGGMVNGSIEKPDKVLRDGDIVEVLHSLDKKPNVEWLYEVRTPRARSEIKRWLKRVEHEDRIRIGRDILVHEFERLKYDFSPDEVVENFIREFSCASKEILFEKIAMSSDFLRKFLTAMHREFPQPQESTSEDVRFKVKVAGMESVMVRYASCCNPIPGDTIVGFLTQSRGISVHRDDCPTAQIFMNDRSRVVDVLWDTSVSKEVPPSAISIEAIDRVGLLKDVTTFFADKSINIHSLQFLSQGSFAKVDISVTVASASEIQVLKRELRRIYGVKKVSRRFQSSEKE